MQNKFVHFGILAFLAAGCETTGLAVKPDQGKTENTAQTNSSQQGPDVAAMVKKSFGEVFGGGGGAQSAGGKFKETGLYGIFKDKQGVGNGWPRLAITINKLPPYAYKSATAIGKDEYFQLCMNYSAVLWTSAKDKKEIPAQDFCWRDVDRAFRPADNYFLIEWAYTKKRQKGNTGLTRTTGPNPPITSMIEGSAYSNFVGSRGAYIIQAMFGMMDFDPGSAERRSDYRVWIVKIPSEIDQTNTGEDKGDQAWFDEGNRKMWEKRKR